MKSIREYQQIVNNYEAKFFYQNENYIVGNLEPTDCEQNEYEHAKRIIEWTQPIDVSLIHIKYNIKLLENTPKNKIGDI